MIGMMWEYHCVAPNANDCWNDWNDVGISLCCPKCKCKLAHLRAIPQKNEKDVKLEACLSACLVTCRREAIQSVGTSAESMHIMSNLKALLDSVNVGCKLAKIFIFVGCWMQGCISLCWIPECWMQGCISLYNNIYNIIECNIVDHILSYCMHN